jgi:hypothetical protein
MNFDYCDKECPIGIKASKEFLDKNNSAFDAALDFACFIKKCSETCHFRDKSSD